MPLNKTAADFYRIVGPWLGNRQIENEIGYPVYNDPDTQWIAEPGLGFVTFRVWAGGQHGRINVLYVAREHRLQGRAVSLVSKALTQIGEGRVTVSANRNSRHLFEGFGFTAVRETKNFTAMELR